MTGLYEVCKTIFTVMQNSLLLRLYLRIVKAVFQRCARIATAAAGGSRFAKGRLLMARG